MNLLHKVITTALCLTLLGLQSCDTKEEKFDFSGSGICVINDIQLGDLNRPVHTKTKEGKDTVVVTKVSGAKYLLSIDQVNNRIFNVDSLPVNTDMKHGIFSKVGTMQAISIKTLGSDKDTLFVLKDTLDLSQPRELTVWGMNGMSKRVYTLDIRCHKEVADSFKWSKVAVAAPLKEAVAMRSFVKDNQLYAFADKAGKSVVLVAPTAELENMESTVLNDVSAENVQSAGSAFYSLNSAGQLVRSEDGKTWEVVNDKIEFERLLAVNEHFVAAANENGIYTSKDGGAVFEKDEIDEPHKIPLEECVGISLNDKDEKNTQTFLVFGRADGQYGMWMKNVIDQSTFRFPWAYMDVAHLPQLGMPQLVSYDNGITLVGKNEDEAYSKIYHSKDGGMTWTTDGWQFPHEMVAPSAISVAVDAKDFVYLICSSTGEIWRGRLNRLGWHNPPTVFD